MLSRSDIMIISVWREGRKLNFGDGGVKGLLSQINTDEEVLIGYGKSKDGCSYTMINLGAYPENLPLIIKHEESYFFAYSQKKWLELTR